MNLWGFFFVAAGVFSLCGGVFDWGWFMESRKARFLAAIIGRNGARVFYAGLGGLIAALGALAMLGVIDFKDV